MSNTKKPETKEASKPLENPDIKVNVVPQNEKNPDHVNTSRKLKKALEENVRKAIEKNAPGGQEKQFDAAGSETKRAAKDTDSKQVKEVRVNVSGTDKDGDEVRKAWIVPTEKKAPPP